MLQSVFNRRKKKTPAVMFALALPVTPWQATGFEIKRTTTPLCLPIVRSSDTRQTRALTVAACQESSQEQTQALTTPVNLVRGSLNKAGLLSNESPSNGRGTLSTRWLPATGKRGKYAEKKGNPAIKLRVINQIKSTRSMKNTFYATHVIEYLQTLAAPEVKNLIERIRSSIKFRLPDGGDILKNPPQTSLISIFEKGPWRLPYPCICVEYDCPDGLDADTVQFSKTVVLAYEDGGDLFIWPFPYLIDTSGGYRDWSISTGVRLNPMEFQVIPFCEEARKVIDGRIDRGETTVEEIVRLDLAREVASIGSLMAALSCKNVSTLEIHAPPALAKARQRRGKEPIYSYRILEIETPLPSSTKSAGGMTHASPRIHLRRGHIRRLPKHTVWVNACVVGNKERGMVVKDYEVTNHRAQSC